MQIILIPLIHNYTFQLARLGAKFGGQAPIIDTNRTLNREMDTKCAQNLLEKKELAEKQARALLDKKTGKSLAFKKLLQFNYTGFTHYYLMDHIRRTTKNRKILSTPNIDTMMKLAEYDYEIGVKVTDLVFHCCRLGPSLQFVEFVLGLDKIDTETTQRNVLKKQDSDGNNCLTVIFEVPVRYHNDTKKWPSSTEDVMREITKTVWHLINLADRYQLDILNHLRNDGVTLFALATRYSEELAVELLNRNVQVKSVNNVFLTPSFRVSNFVIFWLISLVN